MVTQVADLRDLSDLVLPIKTFDVIARVLGENRHADELAKHGLRPNNRLLMCGPPGCGKTVAAGAIANALGIPLLKVQMDAVISSYMGTTSANLRKVFDIANSQRVVLFFDEVDAIGRERAAKTDDLGEIKRITNSLLTMLEEVKGPSLVIAATNHEITLDSALWRRFDEVAVFPMPTIKEAITLLRTLCARFMFQGNEEAAAAGVQLAVGRLFDSAGNAIRDPNYRTNAAVAHPLNDMSFADIERVATDAAKSSLLDGEIVDLAIAKAITRQADRKSLSSKAS